MPKIALNTSDDIACDAVASDVEILGLFKSTVRSCILPKNASKKGLRQTVWDRSAREAIFRKWYEHHGKRYFFLFKKNLRVTNVQFAELLALIRVHLLEGSVQKKTNADKSLGQPVRREVQFISSTDFHFFAEKLFRPFVMSGRDRKEVSTDIDRMIERYAEMFFNLIAFDSYFGSCVVYAPPGLQLDLPAICAHAGYVHSCGMPLFVENVNDAEASHLQHAIESHVSREAIGLPLRLIVYAHEEFSEVDRDWEPQLRDGLNDVKLNEQKFYLGREPLVRALQSLKRGKLAKHVIVIRSSRTPREVKSSAHPKRFDRTRSLWLISDRSTAKEITTPGHNRFVICFEQHFKNCNPTHIFEENKPAWVSQTTIPHSLMGAMINLTKPYWRSKGKILCGDPFAGSGTTWFEAEKHKRVICVCSDRAPISARLLIDNIEFLKARPHKLKSLIANLTKLMAQLKRIRQSDCRGVVPYLPESVCSLVERHRQNKNKRPVAKLSFEILTGFGLDIKGNGRVRPLRKAHLLPWRARRRASRTSLGIWTRELDRSLLDGEPEPAISTKSPAQTEKRESEGRDSQGICIIEKEFSDGCVIWPETFERFKAEYPRPVMPPTRDVASIHYGLYDVIATDPPYGFNEDMTLRQLSGLYAKLFTHLIRALKDDGQLVVADPRCGAGRQAVPGIYDKVHRH